MRVLSKQAETKLIAAIEKAAEYANSGMSPNDAIIKSASEADVPAGHINLMVHAYNTGRTTKQRETGEGTLEKAADFQLADADVVLKALYPETVKTSAEIVRDQVVSTEYAVSPRHMLARRQNELKKAAAAAAALPEKTYTPPPRDELLAAQRSVSEKIAAQRVREETRREATVAYHNAASALEKLSEYFRRPGNMSFQDAVAEVGRRFGEDGVNVLNKVAAVYPHFAKQSATKTLHVGDNVVYGLVDNVLSAVEHYNAVKLPEEKTAEKKNSVQPEIVTGSVLDAVAVKPLELKQAYTARGAGNWNNAGPADAEEAADVYRAVGIGNEPPPEPRTPFEHPEQPPQPRTDSGWDEDWAENFSAGGNRRGGGDNNSILGAVAQAVGRGMGRPVTDMAAHYGLTGNKEEDYATKLKNLKMREYQNLTAPDHETALKNIKAQATLHDMLLNDDVISGHDPKEVAIAFNEIANVAPGVVDSPAVLQALLRKRLEAGQLADFDVKQLIEMDKLKAERDKLRTETMEKERNLV